MSVENWFEETRVAIKQAFNSEADLFSKLLAGTSPLTDIRTNVKLACKAYQHICWFGAPQPGGFIHTHVVCMRKLMNGTWTSPESCQYQTHWVSGRKVWSLYQNLIGNEQVCPIDRWMLRYYGYAGDTRMTSELYSKLEDKIKDEAAKLNITPAQRQVQIWCSQRANSGTVSGGSSRGNESYGEIIKARHITSESLARRLI